MSMLWVCKLSDEVRSSSYRGSYTTNESSSNEHTYVGSSGLKTDTDKEDEEADDKGVPPTCIVSQIGDKEVDDKVTGRDDGVHEAEGRCAGVIKVVLLIRQIKGCLSWTYQASRRRRQLNDASIEV